MPKSTHLTMAATAFVLAASTAGFAQDETVDARPAPVIKQVDIFTSADIDADGALDRDEFVSFVVMTSDAGDPDYSSIKLAGTYDDHFNTKDYNADGLLTAEELKPFAADPEKADASEEPKGKLN